ncbi:MAG: 50S ribosomal protein L6 [Myxococcaceae bacterium]|nr:50S ribosomal protein L6 [Myxococcaceae bacterium]
MSRIGKLPIQIPDKVKVNVGMSDVVIEGPKGKLTVPYNKALMDVSERDGHIEVKRANDGIEARSLHGLTRTLLSNAIKGVTVGFEDVLEINGVGYRAELKGNVLTLNLGYSHPIDFSLPAGIQCEVDKQTRVVIRGIDKALVGQTAAKIRDFKKTEPYKGKGVKYAGEQPRRKVGKQGVA